METYGQLKITAGHKIINFDSRMPIITCFPGGKPVIITIKDIK